jgi:hypothetical protein
MVSSIAPSLQAYEDDLRKRRLGDLNPDANEVYEFGCHGSFGSSTTVRIIRRGSQIICVSHVNRFYEAEIYDAKIVEEWGRLQAMLRRVDFWRLPKYGTACGLDGETWTLEGREGTAYHRVQRWSPCSGSVFDLGMLFVDIAGVTMPSDKP